MNLGDALIPATMIIFSVAIFYTISYKATKHKEMLHELEERMDRDRIPTWLDYESDMHYARRTHPAGKQRVPVSDPARHDRATDA